MLSTDLEVLADGFAPYRGDGLELKPEGVQAFVEALRDLSRQAKELERHVVPAEARFLPADFDGHDNVVLLRRRCANPAPPWGWGDAS